MATVIPAKRCPECAKAMARGFDVIRDLFKFRCECGLCLLEDASSGRELGRWHIQMVGRGT